MAGEIAGVGAMNDDFMAQMYFNKMAQNAGGAQGQGQQYPQGGATNPAFQGGAQTDTFERSGSGLATGAVLGTVGAAGAGGTAYCLARNPINKDGVVNGKMINVMDKAAESNYFKLAKEAGIADAKQAIYGTDIPSQEAYDAVKKLSKTTLDKLTAAEQALIPDAFKDPADAKAYVDLAEEQIAKIDVAKIEKAAKEAAKSLTLGGNEKLLAQQKLMQPNLTALADDVAGADLVKFIKENKAAFGLSGTEDEITQAAGVLAKKTKATLVTELADNIAQREETVKGIRKALSEAFVENFDKEAKALKSDAPEILQKAFKNFKLKQAGFWGGIIGGSLLLAGCLFGGGGQQPKA